ncbi:oxygen-independent coproporphyrinogen III oxidase [Xanthovirga aplysinae]|uniref:oxygen-independent coproporphyrinogen III oxidase n=1 Tax=Xanthovirga aplysinae TaxID=2529853 RepID=UPI0012BC0EB0|nr:oxygen-independent coproporphyrinogen III oxidase [Xanthovirga aplysinae]MTI33382.1 oxygen-independent coproporphyrinogen III oxidase [Xanthovirga aplysinae]
MKTPEALIRKYNVPAPRYTSYPTVPCWENEIIKKDHWLDIVNTTFEESNEKEGISLYIHLPFCESLCTYCGCNTRITKNHKVEKTYSEALVNEWGIYLNRFSGKPQIRELHLGGGTPTFFSPENLKDLLTRILKNTDYHPDFEFSFEGHPNNTSAEHLRVLYDLGFSRVSFGIQDFDEKVQKTINRLQTYEKVVEVTHLARSIGYESVNYDLIYGLPYQSPETIRSTIEKVAQLMPDRIAFYSYAHVPWIKPGQRSYTSADLPDNEAKRALYELGKSLLVELGYFDIGMDHFSLPHDPLYKAFVEKSLHRNFMGYTTGQTELLLGLGASSISDAKYAYGQNIKLVETYQKAVNEGNNAVFRGHIMTEEDLLIRQSILDIACRGALYWEKELMEKMDGKIRVELINLLKDGLIDVDSRSLHVTPLGQAFIRNICMAFDKRKRDQESGGKKQFSKAI